MKMYKVDKLQIIDLGVVGENQAKVIDIDVSAWLDKWPEASFEIIAVRPGETVPYPADTILIGTVLKWVVDDADVGIAGIGKCDVRAYQADTIVKTIVAVTRIAQTLPYSEEEDIPETAQSWVDRVARARAHIDEVAQGIKDLSVESEIDPEKATDVEYDAAEAKLKFYLPNYPIVWMDENGVLNINDATGPLQPGETRLLWEFPNDFCPRNHTHQISDVTGLADALAGKAAANHTHTMESITGLPEAVAALVPEIDSAAITLTAAGWTGAEAPYTQTVSCAKAKADNNLITGPGALTAAQHTAMVNGQIVCTGQAAGEITFKAFGSKPDADIPVNVLAIG